MTIDRIVRLMAGVMILLSLALTHYVHPYWAFLTLFVGANLMQSGITNICPLSSVLKKFGVPDGTACSG
ncbi:MAG: DUF2892 domain-containing protein [endosymbiont of Seepiophila jonesi]|uniref:DUF2892 domain-containing protein n=1 Tax=endosymbiont of Lamellibrachia luymesi TaxID=2200907 RepID=A0A370DXN6_9GAMM|nr:MAG: DUF2892 domain-containing protein [endosymbiont of Lamellibrachia luymesi]RDH93261.1 MAG: DUF2892 domain-containing protein [endosymbiont of Seepiophila jonesi]